LKGAVATLAAQKAFEAALGMERLARSKDMSQVDKAYAVLDMQVQRLRSVLETVGAGKESVHTSGTR
jgi:hypothetical protein